MAPSMILQVNLLKNMRKLDEDQLQVSKIVPREVKEKLCRRREENRREKVCEVLSGTVIIDKYRQFRGHKSLYDEGIDSPAIKFSGTRSRKNAPYSSFGAAIFIVFRRFHPEEASSSTVDLILANCHWSLGSTPHSNFRNIKYQTGNGSNVGVYGGSGRKSGRGFQFEGFYWFWRHSTWLTAYINWLFVTYINITVTLNPNSSPFTFTVRVALVVKLRSFRR
ncbi:hypothetical protein L1887_41762 [Cichorium endivia]|nr:hypothetical protein L1887_41762 [Cichorium endivia]